MPARTLNDFFAGFFMTKPKKVWRLTVQNDRRKSSRRQSHRRKIDIETIKIAGEGDHGQEVTVRYETAPQRKQKSAFSWFEEFTMEWSETFISKK